MDVNPIMDAAAKSYLVAKTQSEIRLYIHYPFCKSKCPYCAFPSICDRSLEKKYLDALICEVESFETKRKIVSIYFGGGSPSLIDIRILEYLISRLKQFTCEPVEITVELRPEDCSSNALEEYAKIGVNRVSIGVQSLLPEKLKIFRRQSLNKRLHVPKGMAISFDIIIGTIVDDRLLHDELYNVLGFKPDHLSIYPLSLEKGSYFFGNPPNVLSQNIGKQYEICHDILSSNGYVRYESSNFYRSEQSICRHNLGYWRNEDYIGLGVAANSKIGRFSWERSFNILDYIHSIYAGRKSISRRTELTDLEYAEETLLMGLRLMEGIPINCVLSRSPDLESIMSRVELLRESNLIVLEEDIIKAVRSLNFDECLQTLGWETKSHLGWRTIVPKKLSK